eukprot:TRINITY_DN21425_c0_g1_i1.p1 TRINITY_DN21425_c0_g1~~TRINITY_DN21425_c0_g1_i1.p1  ORF type:complete len:936 (+),score=351.19 TRINITY_DN21425_c0_g1_i1:83-2890(+)
MASPTAQQLEEVAKALAAGLNVADRAAQVAVNDWITANTDQPQFNAALAAVGASHGAVPDAVRTVALFTLKNAAVRDYPRAVHPCKDAVQGQLMRAVADPCDSIRAAAASCVAAAAKHGGVADWPSLLPDLWAQLAGDDAARRRGIILCVRDICEDCAADLDRAPAPGVPAPSGDLLTRLVQFVGSTADATELAYGVDALRYLLSSDAAGKASSTIAAVCGQLVSPILQAGLRCMQLCSGGGRGASRVRASMMSCLRVLMFYYRELKAAGVVQELYAAAFSCVADADAEVALAGVEFWDEASHERAAVRDLVQMGTVHIVIATLLRKMPYSDLEVAMLEDEETRPQLDPPTRHRAPTRRRIEDDGGDDDDVSQMSSVEQYSARTCAASALERLAETLEHSVVTPPGQQAGWLLNTELQPRLGSADWREQEAAVLALGCVAKGSPEALTPIHKDMAELLLTIVSPESPHHWLVKSIAFYTLSQVDGWVVAQHESGNSAYLERYLALLLAGLKDGKKKVQCDAVSAFAELVCRAGSHLHNPAYLSQILPALSKGLTPAGFTARNLIILLDAVQTLTHGAGEALATPQGHGFLFTPLVTQLLPATPDAAVVTPNVLVCIAIVARSLGPGFLPYAELCTRRAVSFIGGYYQARAAFMEAPHTTEEPDDEVFILYFDIVSQMVHGVSRDASALESIRALLAGTMYPGTSYTMFDFGMVPLLQPALACDVRPTTAATSFVGEHLVKFAELQRLVLAEGSLSAMVSYLSSDDAACNDVCWLLGEASPLLGSPERHALGGSVLERLVCVLQTAAGDQPFELNTLMNAALSAARFGSAADVYGRMVEPVATLVLSLITRVPDGADKEAGMIGVLTALGNCPGSLRERRRIGALLSCMTSFQEMSPQLEQACKWTLVRLKGEVGAMWQSIRDLFPATFPVQLLQP